MLCRILMSIFIYHVRSTIHHIQQTTYNMPYTKHHIPHIIYSMPYTYVYIYIHIVNIYIYTNVYIYICTYHVCILLFMWSFGAYSSAKRPGTPGDCRAPATSGAAAFGGGWLGQLGPLKGIQGFRDPSKGI